MTLAEFRRRAMALEGTHEEPHFDFASFRVKGRIFATVPPAGTHVHLFVDDADRERAVAMDPEGVEPLHWGGKVVGVRVALKHTPIGTLDELLRAAWRRRAAGPTRRPRKRS